MMIEGKAQPMTVAQLHEATAQAIKAGCGNWTVSVPYKAITPSIGAAPMEPVVMTSRGFDWEHGKLLLYTRTPLGPSEQRVEEIGRKAQKAGQSVYLARRALEQADTPPEERIAAALRILGASPDSPRSPRRVKP